MFVTLRATLFREKWVSIMTADSLPTCVLSLALILLTTLDKQVIIPIFLAYKEKIYLSILCNVLEIHVQNGKLFFRAGKTYI